MHTIYHTHSIFCSANYYSGFVARWAKLQRRNVELHKELLLLAVCGVHLDLQWIYSNYWCTVSVQKLLICVGAALSLVPICMHPVFTQWLVLGFVSPLLYTM